MMSEWWESYSVVSESGQPKPKSESGLSWEEYSKGLARQIEQGLTFGFADEIEAFLSEKLLGQPREKAIKGIRSEMGKFRKEHPAQAVVAEIGGSMLTPMGRAKTLGGQAAEGAVGGALYGLGVGEGDISDRMSSAIGGGLAGAALPFAAPAVKQSAQRLKKIGVPLTIGQETGGLVGSALRTTEEALATLPVVGTPIKAARQEALRKFGTATFNEALEPLSNLGVKKMPMAYTPRKAAIESEKQISKVYKDIYSRMANKPTLDDMYSAIDSVQTVALDKLGQKGWADLRSNLRDIVQRRAKDGKLSAEGWKEAHSVIRDNAILKKGAVTNDVSVAQGSVMSEVQDAIFDAMIAKNPDVASDIKSVGKSYRMWSTLDELVRKKDIEEAGTFMPSQLLSAVRRDPYASKRQVRELEAPLQKTARAGQDILPSQLGSSGTEERRMVSSYLLPALGGVGGAGLAYYDPQMAMYGAGGLGAGALTTGALYSRLGQGLLRPLVSGGLSSAMRSPAAAGLLGSSVTE